MEGLTGSGKGGTSGSFRSRLQVAPASPFADYIHDGISKCAMGVGWAQRLIVPTISRSAEFVHIGGHGNAVPALHDFREPDVPAAILCGPVRAAWAGVHISGSSKPMNADRRPLAGPYPKPRATRPCRQCPQGPSNPPPCRRSSHRRENGQDRLTLPPAS